MIRTQISLTEEQWNKLKKLSAERKVSMSELVRQGVDLLVETSNTITLEERRRRALAGVGFIKGDGPTDLSTNHDKYLEEAYSTHEDLR
jgi:hypothetical protein